MWLRALLALFALATLAVMAGVRFALLLAVGLGIGYSLEKFGFGFAGPWRRFIRDRNPQGLIAQFWAIGLAALILQPVIAGSENFVGAIAPVSVSMILAAAVFGFAMQLVLGCGSGTLVNAGSGNLIALVALPLFCVGSFLGTLLLPAAMDALPHARVSLSEALGVSGGVGLTLGLLAALAALAAWRGQGPWFNKRLFIAATVLAGFAGLHLFIAGQPWGVVYGLGLWVAKAASGLGWDPAMSAFWSHPINTRALTQSVLTDYTSLTNFGLVAGAALAAWKAAGEQPLTPALKNWIWLIAAGAGLLLGVSSRLAFGCNVGALFSGIASGSLHGWAWLVAGFLGSVAGVRLRDSLWARASA